VRWPPAAFAAAAVCYSTWLLGPALNPAIHPAATVASELAARDQPWSWVFRAGDLSAGALALSAGAYLAVPARGWLRVGWVAAAVFGLATVLDAGLTPLSCAPSVDPGCPSLTADEFTEPHSWTSSFAVAGGMASLVALSLAARRSAPRFALAGAVLAVLAIATSLVTLVQILGDGDTEGIWQRGQLAGLSAWLLYAAAAAALGGRPGPRRGGRPGPRRGS
jgi:hypothetical protein